MKKIIAAMSMAILFCLASFVPVHTKINAGTEQLKINAKNFPDMYFRYYIRNTFDINNDKKLSLAERNKVKKIDVGENSEYQLEYEYPKAETVKGIEYFPNLEELDCSESGLSSLDISRNKKLRELYCNGNNLEKLNVSKNKELQKLNCSDNDISSLKIGANKKLRQLFCDENQLKKLEVKKNKKLVELSVSNNKLKKLKIEKLKKLKELYCDTNRLTSLKLSKNRNLITLNCSYNKLKKLQLKKNKKLDYLACSGNRISKLDLSKNRLLQYLYCDKNRMVTGNCRMGSSQLENAKISVQTKKIKVRKKKEQYFVPLSNLNNTNALTRLSHGKVGQKGIWIKGKKCPVRITYEYNMFTDGKKKTKVVLELK